METLGGVIRTLKYPLPAGCKRATDSSGAWKSRPSTKTQMSSEESVVPQQKAAMSVVGGEERGVLPSTLVVREGGIKPN